MISKEDVISVKKMKISILKYRNTTTLLNQRNELLIKYHHKIYIYKLLWNELRPYI